MKTRARKDKRKAEKPVPFEYLPRTCNGWVKVLSGGGSGYMRARLIHSLALAAALLGCCLPARATLTVTLTPGYSFAPNEMPTTETLNELGMPTIVISGTIGGSNTLSPGSVSGVSLADSVPDGGAMGLPIGQETIGWDVANPRELDVNCAGLVNGTGGIIGGPNPTNALFLFVDPTFFELATNTGGNDATNQYPSSNTGSTVTNWLTLRHNAINDANITTGGISSVSINTNGLCARSLNTLQILTNVYVLSGSSFTNTVTNYNTVIVGNPGSNGLGLVAQLGDGMTVATVTNIWTYTNMATVYYATNSYRQLQFAGFNGSLPLVANLGPWTNSFTTNVCAPTYTWFTNVYNFYAQGGAPPYGPVWTVTNNLNIVNKISGGFFTNFSNGGLTMTLVESNNWETFDCEAETVQFWIFCTVTDATAQITSGQAAWDIQFQ